MSKFTEGPTNLIYWETPIGRSLKESMEELGITGELEEKIVENFDQQLLKEFDLPSNTPTNHRCGTRNKMTADCKHYNNIHYVWNFNIEKFSVLLEDGANFKDKECTLKTVPHGDFQVKTKTQKKRIEKMN